MSMNFPKNNNSINKAGKILTTIIWLTASQLFTNCKSSDTTITPAAIKPSTDRTAKEKQLNQNLSLKPNSEIPIMSIYLWYSKDKKNKLDDVIFEESNKSNAEWFMNTQLSNIINNIKIVNWLQQYDWTTNRKVKMINSSLVFNDAEIDKLAKWTSAISILNNTTIREYIIAENIKRIDLWLMPIVQVHIIIWAEIYDASWFTNSSLQDWFWFTVPYSSKNPIMTKNQIVAPSWEIHELFWHMISPNHQKLSLKFVNSPTWVDNFKYYEWLLDNENKDNLAKMNWWNSIDPYTCWHSWNSIMLENWQSKIIKKKWYTNDQQIDTLSLKNKDWSIWVIQTIDGLYDGNNNRKMREWKYNQMVAKYISAYITAKKSNSGARSSNEIKISQEILNNFKIDKEIKN